MPFYEYYSEETGEEKEVFHGINEEPEIFDSKNNPMKRKISTIGNFVMGKNNKDATRNNTTHQRHGHKKRWSTRTPLEASKAKAQEANERHEEKKHSDDPYYNWR